MQVTGITSVGSPQSSAGSDGNTTHRAGKRIQAGRVWANNHCLPLGSFPARFPKHFGFQSAGP